ncbi:MAG: tetratricopeptide repeat protein [Candidatus Babeliales bacterium]
MSKKISKNYSINYIDKLIFLQNVIPVFILTILTTLFYFPSLRYPFQFDDIANITKKFVIRMDNPLSRWTTHSRWMSDWLNNLNYKIGLFDPFYYRSFNLIIHVLSGLILFFLILDLCKFLKKENFLNKNSLLVAFSTAALFLLHPVQTQTVSYVIQARLEGLASLFILTTVLFFVKAFKTQNIFYRSLLILLSMIVAVLSCGTKEICVVIPFLILLVDWFFISQGEWTNFKKRFFLYLGFALIFLIILFRYIDFNFFIKAIKLQLSTGNNRGNIITPHAYDTITASYFLLSQFKVLLHYITMFIWPFSICVEYDWVLSESFFQPNVFFPFFIIMSLIFTSIYMLIKKTYGFISFGLLWFFITMAPRTSIIPSPELVCDYKTYLASAGLMFILGTSFAYLIKYITNLLTNIQLNIPANKYSHQLALLLIFILPIGYSTIIRNKVWSSSSAFWFDIVKKSPLKARGHNNLGVSLCEEGKVDLAIEHYKIAIKLDEHYADPYSNIGVAYSMKNEIDKAIAAFKGAINIHANYPEAYNNIGTLLLKKQNYQDAEKALLKAIELRPYYGKAFYNLGRLYVEKKDDETAWQYFKKATQGDLDTPEGFFTLGQISIKTKKFDEAVKAFETILKRGISNPQILFNLANSYFMTKDYDKAENLYYKLTQDHPLEGKYLFNLGETLFLKNDFQNALKCFQKITTLPESLALAHFKIANCLEQLNKQDEAKKYLTDLLNTQAPEDFKNNAKQELARLELQDKLKTSNNSIKVSELKGYLKKIAGPENKPVEVKNA